VAVWFDNLEIKLQGALIAQEHHYDPWGLELKGIVKQGAYRYTFNAQSEKQADLNGGKGYFYETDWRGYDPQLGRFHAIDQLADFYPGITPYQFAFNNPISFNDPTGVEGVGPEGENLEYDKRKEIREAKKEYREHKRNIKRNTKPGGHRKQQLNTAKDMRDARIDAARQNDKPTDTHTGRSITTHEEVITKYDPPKPPRKRLDIKIQLPEADLDLGNKPRR